MLVCAKTYGYHLTVLEWWSVMNDPIPEQQWDVRAAYRKGWEVRMAYYDKLLGSVRELLESSVKIMKVDGMSEAIESLQKALLALEDAWSVVSLEWTAALAAREQEEQRE
jgi:hypothetical protein